MNILKHELKLYRKATITWNISILFILLMFYFVFPAFSKSANLMNTILENFPEGFKSAMGFYNLDLSSAIGFYGFIFIYIGLVGGIQSMNLGLSLVSNEMMDKTADFLLSKPRKRINILNAKLSAGLIYIIITNILFFISSKIFLDFLSKEEYLNKIFIAMALSLFLIQLFFLSFGMMLSSFMNKLKSVVSISLGTVFGFFILNMLNESLASKPLTAFTPFAYFSTRIIYENKGYDIKWLTVNLFLVIIFTTIAYIKYIKKDIPSV